MRDLKRILILGLVSIIYFNLSLHLMADVFEEVTPEQIMDSVMSSARMNFSTDTNNRLPYGIVVAYQTEAGRFGKLQVLSEQSSKVYFRWMTYNEEGGVYSSGEEMTVTWTWSGDLDEGIQVHDSNTARDFWLRNIDGTERYLIPQNGARFGLMTSPLFALPHLADGGGIRSELLLTNWGDQSNTGVAYLFDSEGIPMSWSVNNVLLEGLEYSIPPGGAFRIVTDGEGETKVGHALLCPDEGYQQISGTVVYQIDPFEVSVAQVMPSPRFHVFVESGQAVNSGIAVANPGHLDLVIQAHLVDEQGTVVDSLEISLPPRGHRARFLTELFTSVPSDFQGSIHLESEGEPFSMVGIRQRQNGSVALLPGAPGSIILN